MRSTQLLQYWCPFECCAVVCTLLRCACRNREKKLSHAFHWYKKQRWEGALRGSTFWPIHFNFNDNYPFIICFTPCNACAACMAFFTARSLSDDIHNLLSFSQLFEQIIQQINEQKTHNCSLRLAAVAISIWFDFLRPLYTIRIYDIWRHHDDLCKTISI